MPTLLQINSVINWGSTGHIAESIGQFAIRNGWKSYIAYGRKNQASQSRLIRIGTDFDMVLHGLQTRLFDRHGFGSKHATKKLVERIKQIKPDVIHLHNLHGYYINIEVLFKYLASENIPVVWTLHDCWALTGHCAHFDTVKCNKWKTGCFNCPLKTNYTSSILIDRSKENYREKRTLFNSVKNLTIVPVSSWLGNVVNDSFLKNNTVQVINNGIDLKVFSPQKNGDAVRGKLGIGNRFMIVGVASVWPSIKGLNDFIELSKRMDQKEFAIVLIGLNKKQLKQLPLTIMGIPRTENIQQLVEIYSAADIVLNLSILESFGLTTVEGFACGTPGIVYNSTASPELISSDTGFVVEKMDYEGILNKIELVRERGKAFYTKACRARANSHYNKKDRYRDYMELYDRLITESGCQEAKKYGF